MTSTLLTLMTIASDVTETSAVSFTVQDIQIAMFWDSVLNCILYVIADDYEEYVTNDIGNLARMLECGLANPRYAYAQ